VLDRVGIIAALRAVPGVSEADLEPDQEGGLGVLRLCLRDGADEVAVAGEVGRLLRERFGLGVDAERVQLVEDTYQAPDSQEPESQAPDGQAPESQEPESQEPEPPEESEAPLSARPAIVRMQLLSSGLEVTVVVTLRHRAARSEGSSTGTATQVGVQRAVATATLRALENLLGPHARFELEDVDVTAHGEKRTALVSLLMLSAAGSERLTGAAAVRDDVRQACIRATLDAANRRLEPLLR
jgi:hypothetical protein